MWICVNSASIMLSVYHRLYCGSTISPSQIPLKCKCVWGIKVILIDDIYGCCVCAKVANSRSRLFQEQKCTFLMNGKCNGQIFIGFTQNADVRSNKKLHI